MREPVNMNPYAYSPRLAGSDHTDHRLITVHKVLTDAPVTLYTAPASLTSRFINCLFCNVSGASASVYLDHWDEEDQMFTYNVFNVPVANASPPYLFEGGDVALAALHPGDFVRVWADTDAVIHAHLTIEENHARLLG